MYLVWQRYPPANCIYSSNALSKLTVLACYCQCYQVAGQVLQLRTASLAASVSIVESSEPGVANQGHPCSLRVVLASTSSSS